MLTSPRNQVPRANVGSIPRAGDSINSIKRRLLQSSEPRGSPCGEQQQERLYSNSTGPSILPFYYEAVGRASKRSKNTSSPPSSGGATRPLSQAGDPEHPGLAQRGKTYLKGALQRIAFPAIPSGGDIPTTLERRDGTIGTRGSPDRVDAEANVDDPLTTEQETKVCPEGRPFDADQSIEVR